MSHEEDRQQAGRLIPMRAVVDGASLEGLRGIRAVLETEIAILQRELEEVKKRISEKEDVGYPEQP